MSTLYRWVTPVSQPHIISGRYQWRIKKTKTPCIPVHHESNLMMSVVSYFNKGEVVSNSFKYTELEYQEEIELPEYTNSAEDVLNSHFVFTPELKYIKDCALKAMEEYASQKHTEELNEARSLAWDAALKFNEDSFVYENPDNYAAYCEKQERIIKTVVDKEKYLSSFNK